jgi:hypothetical protein
LQCLYVFTLGSKQSDKDNALESAYLVSRAAFANMIRESAKYIAQYGSREILQAIEKETALISIRFIAKVATFFELNVTEKLIAEAIPLVGALGGAAINAAFCDYFVDASRYHFGLLNLEKRYGSELIQRLYADAVVPNQANSAS